MTGHTNKECWYGQGSYQQLMPKEETCQNSGTTFDDSYVSVNFINCNSNFMLNNLVTICNNEMKYINSEYKSVDSI